MTKAHLAVFAILFAVDASGSTSVARFLSPCLPCCSTPAVNQEEAPLAENVESEIDPPNPCVVCFERPSNTYNSACGHLGMCKGCSGKIRKVSDSCPICRTAFTKLKTVKLSPICELCHRNLPNTLNENCNHLCMCNECVDANIGTLSRCPHCQAAITRLVELYLPELSL